MGALRELRDDDCICHDEKSCRIYTNIHGQDQHWCWVDEKKKDICAAKGTTLHYDSGAQKWWGENLCLKADCKCSGIGMHPTAQDLSNQKFSPDIKLQDNKMNYGSECKKWHSDDKWPWCFAGFDSICPDRHPDDRKSRFSADIPQELVGELWQWRSHLPCNERLQEENEEAAVSLCENITMATEVILISLLVLSLPMYVVLFQFISNRCCDFTETEEQFEVEFSDEESEDADVGADEGAEKGSRRPSEDAVAAATHGAVATGS